MEVADYVETPINSEVNPIAIKTASVTHSPLYATHDVKFNFELSADIEKSPTTGLYYFNSIIVARPTVTVRFLSGASATVESPTYELIDGGRTVAVTAKAAIQNKTGSLSYSKLYVEFYLNPTTGNITSFAY